MRCTGYFLKMSKNNLIKIFYKELKWGKEEEMHEGLPVCVSILYFCLTHNRKKDSHRQMSPLHRSIFALDQVLGNAFVFH